MLVSIDKSSVVMVSIIEASGAGGLALWRTYATRFSRFPVDLRSRFRGAGGGMGLTRFFRRGFGGIAEGA